MGSLDEDQGPEQEEIPVFSIDFGWILEWWKAYNELREHREHIE